MSERERARRYLDGPRVVVAGDDERRDGLAARLRAELDEFAVETAPTLDAVAETLDEDVAVVATTRTLPGGTAVDLAELVAERDPAPGVVVFAADVDADLAAATAHGSVTLCPVSGSDPETWAVAEPVRERAADSLGRFARALESDALDALFSDSGAAFFLKDDEARYLRLGAGADLTDEDPVGKTEHDVGHRVDLADAWYEGDREVLESGEPSHRRASVAGVDDDVAFETTRVPWGGDESDLRGLVGYRRRLDHQRARAERLARRAERLEEFVDHVSHDLRNPLLVADGYLELAREGDEAALDRVAAALDRMSELIDDAADLAKSRTVTTDLERTDLREVVDAMWEVAGDPATDATLRADVPPGTVVDAPEAEVRMLFENLFGNAVEHGSTSSDGDPSVTVRVGTLDGGFYVEDDGPGIPESIREDVTDRGFTTTDEGSGVGLSVVSGVADSNDWRFEITDSQLPADDGPGARFEFRDVMFVTEEPDSTPVGDPVPLTESADIGDVTVPGETVYDAETDRWTATGEGINVYHDQVGFHYRYATVEGDARIEGTVVGIEDVYPFSKAGLMVRDSLDPMTAHGFVGRIASGEAEVLWATERGALTYSQQFGNPNEPFERFRLDREGSLVTASVRHGDAWTPVDQRRVALDDTVHLGVVVCSVTPGETCTATLEDVTVRRLEPDPGEG